MADGRIIELDPSDRQVLECLRAREGLASGREVLHFALAQVDFLQEEATFLRALVEGTRDALEEKQAELRSTQRELQEMMEELRGLSREMQLL